MDSSKSLPLRAAFAVLSMPGIVAGFLPWWIQRGPDRWPLALGDLNWIGILLFLPALALFAVTVRDFFVKGRGTLAPWDPPQSLMAEGVYGWSRNPMYVGVVGMIWGQGVWFRSGEVLLYGALIAVIFHFRVILGEEPWLAKSFPEPWAVYKAKVRRWGLFVVCLCVATPALAQVTHPTPENFGYAATATIRRTDTISGDAALDALARRLRALRPAVRFGGEDGVGGADFGQIAEVTLDREGRILVLDRQDKVISRWSTEGRALGRFGRGGGGPLEFHSPTDLVVLKDSTLLVLDRTIGFRHFTWDSVPEYRDVWLQGHTFEDACAFGDGLIGQRVNDDGTVAQIIGTNGIRRRGVGRGYLSVNELVAKLLSGGRVGCLPNGTIAGSSLTLPFVLVWDTTGATIATTRLADFIPMGVAETDDGLTYSLPPTGYEMVRRIVPVDADHFLVQLAFQDQTSMRERAEYAELRSYLLSARTGNGIYLGTSLPIVAGGQLPTLVGWRNDPIPEVVILR